MCRECTFSSGLVSFSMYVDMKFYSIDYLNTLYCNILFHSIVKSIPYSGKFSRGPIFADWSLGLIFEVAQDLRHTHIDTLKIRGFNFFRTHRDPQKQRKLIPSEISRHTVVIVTLRYINNTLLLCT